MLLRHQSAMNQKQNKKINLDLTNAHRDFEAGLNKRAFFKLSDHMLGEDLVQNTFLKTWQYLVKGGKIDIMKAFLYHVLNNLIVDEYRKHKSISLDALIGKGFEPSVNDIPRMIDKLDGEALILLIRELPLKYQKVMLMRYVQDLSLTEMSDINGQSKNTNAVQLSRGSDLMEALQKKSKKQEE